MAENFHIKKYCHIKKQTISVNGRILFEDGHQDFSVFIKNAYKILKTTYPKFFKMDNLSKLAFLAADVLLKNENLNEEENNIALIFSNRASSLDTDRKHQAAIENSDEYFPSPAVFVYTLPNICLGEISIKHRLYSENSFFIFDRFNAEYLQLYANSLLRSGKAEKVLCGWVDLDENSYDAFLYLVEKEGEIEHKTEEITRLYNIL
ncbi:MULTISPECIES: 3-oxoacyl-ACP synthase [Aequorivita]|uniref:3-oxoacyl-ACP synthase n=1 Tax=Aequorivita iocasae TaxID=2803865 RepID=A0ABX7DUQ0_9FLAO|nr:MULTISPECIES: 3-oxoacyl-ACP synthase [Aequorivita]QQX77871.1 3-oxoacyl-ACP synthase [Aequorivita iocasae]UCA57370.1 3-oxoacyl-ACP synthase [Aequorivita sp. F7]